MPLDVGGTGKETGWLSRWAFMVNALAADAIGRQAIEDAFFSADATMRAKFADSFINAAKLAAGAVTTAKIADSAITSVKLSSALVPYIGVYGYGEYGRCVYNFLT